MRRLPRALLLFFFGGLITGAMLGAIVGLVAIGAIPMIMAGGLIGALVGALTSLVTAVVIGLLRAQLDTPLLLLGVGAVLPALLVFVVMALLINTSLPEANLFLVYVIVAVVNGAMSYFYLRSVQEIEPPA